MQALVCLLLLAANPAARFEILGAPVWIAEGTRLAVAADDGLGPLWYTIDPAGGEPQGLFCEPRYESAEAVWWSPDGRRMAFVASQDGDRLIFAWDLTDDAPVALGHVGEVARPAAAWSPDGRRLAYCRRLPGNPRVAYEVVAGLWDGSGPQAHVGHPEPVAGLAWNRDGTQVAYTLPFADRRNLVVANLVNYKATTISPHLDVADSSAAWLPNGRRLTFTRVTDPRRPGPLYGCRADGLTYAEGLGVNGLVPNEPVRWSPDGAWATWRQVTPTDRGGHIYIAPAEQWTAGRRLARRRGYTEDAAFRADSRLIAYTHYLEYAPLRCFVAFQAPDAEEPRRVVDLDGTARLPAFSPDSTRLAVVAGPRRHARVVVIDLGEPTAPPVDEAQHDGPESIRAVAP